MTTFTVDPLALQALAGRLARTGGDLAAAGSGLRGCSSGLPGLDEAMVDLVRAWRSGLERTGHAAERTAEQLSAAARSYADVDARIAAACS